MKDLVYTVIIVVFTVMFLAGLPLGMVKGGEYCLSISAWLTPAQMGCVVGAWEAVEVKR
jgi:hypothetical protein